MLAYHFYAPSVLLVLQFFNALPCLTTSSPSTTSTVQYEEGMHQAAARNYHTATVYFRVLESMVPRLTSRVHASLNYAACRTQQSSHLLENLVHEHFEGLRYEHYSSL